MTRAQRPRPKLASAEPAARASRTVASQTGGVLRTAAPSGTMPMPWTSPAAVRRRRAHPAQEAVLADPVDQGPQVTQRPAGGAAGQREQGVEGLAGTAADGEQEPVLGLLLWWCGDRVQARPVVGGCAHGAVLSFLWVVHGRVPVTGVKDPKDRLGELLVCLSWE